LAAPSVSVAGSRPGQDPAKLAPSSTVSDPPCFGAPLALAEVVLVLVLDDPHAARPTATTAARQTDAARPAGRLILRLTNVLGLTSLLPPIEMLRYGQAAALRRAARILAGAVGRPRYGEIASPGDALSFRDLSGARPQRFHGAKGRCRPTRSGGDLLLVRGQAVSEAPGYGPLVHRGFAWRFGVLCFKSLGSCGTGSEVPA